MSSMGNVYPVWWDTTVTIYNKHEDPNTQLIRWYQHKVEGCFWKNVGDKVSIADTVLDTNRIICRIRKNGIFLEKYQWETLGNDEKEGYFTLAQGDIIVRGEVTDVVDEYTSGHRSTDLIAKYKGLQGCMEIEEVGINVGAGRCCEHYHVKGI